MKEKLFPGSAVANPIDFLATGTAEQLATIIDYVDKKFDHIDAMAVIFGTPGLSEIYDVYDVLEEKIRTSVKPVYPVMPSTLTAKNEVEAFVAKGRAYFPDEVNLAIALSRVYYTHKPFEKEPEDFIPDKQKVREVIDNAGNGYLSPEDIQLLLDAVGLPRVHEQTFYSREELEKGLSSVEYPVVMKVVGPVHKSDVGGVSLNIKDDEKLLSEFDRMLTIKDARGVLVQPMLSGHELYAGVNRENKFGHIVMFGLGGIFIEVFKDVRSVLTPAGKKEVLNEIRQLRGYKLFTGVRGKPGIDEQKFAGVISRLSLLVELAPEIAEMDLNPLLAEGSKITAIDARIRVEK